MTNPRSTPTTTSIRTELDRVGEHHARTFVRNQPLIMKRPMCSLIRWLVLNTLLLTALICGTCCADQYVFLVGVQDYSQKRELTPLKYAAKDVETLASRFQDAGVRPENIVVMTQQRGATEARFFPNKDQIVKELKLLLGVLRPEDSLIVGFSGHGLQFKGEKVNYFCPIDADPNDKMTLLSLTEVYTQIDSCKAGTKLLLVDACRNDPLSQNSKAARRIQIEPVFSRPAPVFDGGTVAIFSCSESQQSFEHRDIGSGSGVFFHFVDRAFAGDADLDADQMIDLLELEAFAVKNVQNWTRVHLGKEQKPERFGKTQGVPDLLRYPSSNNPSKSFTNSIGATMILIPAGTFQMGSPRSDSESDKDEGPQHRVTLTRSYHLGETEVTQGQWKAVMNTEPWKGKEYIREGDNYPATYISWDDATEFCRRLSALDGRSYRLPTEAEWEYACRAGTTTRYSFGDGAANLSEHGWFDGNTWNVNQKYSHLVKQKRGNAFGLYDMHGNVWEWCSDWYGEYPGSAVVDPVGPATGSFRVFRGGSWNSQAAICRSAYRSGDDPSGRSSIDGFRVALSSSGIPQ
jgi:sulfatase modifying factor 1